jgi:pseudouridine-5'-phosphate glycosidase
VESIVRENGAVPATIAVIDGLIKIGLSPSELEILGSAGNVSKLSVRDIAAAVAMHQHGATTVAATMRIAAMAGIRIFATGGTGGVHRGGAESFDVSADLTELAQTSVAVVSAGVKSILDIGLTLERLETLGVPVIGFGTTTFPAFYSRDSDFDAPLCADTARAVAEILRAKWQLGLAGGALVANPIPKDAEIPATEIAPMIRAALSDMAKQQIGGKDATPFLLGRVVELTDGRSLTANIALVRNNARVAAAIACELTQMYPRERQRRG